MSIQEENGVRIVSIKEAVLADNKNEADAFRADMTASETFLLDVMGSPGSGKTTMLLKTIEMLSDSYRFGVIEGDIASTIDAEKMKRAGIDSIQLRTCGACHIDVPMMKEALSAIGTDYDVLVVENVGNLVCPAEFDTGAHKRVMLLSVPEGYDKVFKYPLMFSICDALVVSKCDTLPVFDDFDMAAVHDGAQKLNPDLRIFELSAKTGAGINEWITWLTEQISEAVKCGEAVSEEAPQTEVENSE